MVFLILRMKKSEKALVFVGKTVRVRNGIGHFCSFSLGNIDIFAC